MESANAAAWILAIATIAVVAIAVLSRRQDMSAKTLQDALRPINEALLRHDKNHADHYNHATDRDSHWTGRERQDLSKRMDTQDATLQRIENKIGSLLERGHDR